jgi:hypothetical protein
MEKVWTGERGAMMLRCRKEAAREDDDGARSRVDGHP